MAESACYHFFPISEFSYKLIRFLVNSSVVKFNNEIGKFFYEGMECPKRTQPMSFTKQANPDFSTHFWLYKINGFQCLIILPWFYRGIISNPIQSTAEFSCFSGNAVWNSWISYSSAKFRLEKLKKTKWVWHNSCRWDQNYSRIPIEIPSKKQLNLANEITIAIESTFKTIHFWFQRLVSKLQQ